MTRAEGVRVAYPLFQAEGGGSTPTSALQLVVEEVDARKAITLNRLWHSVLPRCHLGNIVRNTHNICFAAEFDGIYYATAIWTSPIAANRLKDGFNMLELRRFAIADDAPKNTASRMLAVMTKIISKKMPSIHTLISYQAVDHHAGTIYKAAGWSQQTTSKFKEWKDRPDSTRRRPQTHSDKIRWAKQIFSVLECSS